MSECFSISGVDEAAWASLYSTVSRPFESPTTGKIAIKVINHYGDEVLKVHEIKTDEPNHAESLASSRIKE